MIRRPNHNAPSPAQSPRLLQRLRGNDQAATLPEFAMVLPVLMVLVLGVLDMAHAQFTNSIINGAMQKAGRDLTLESAGSQQATIDKAVQLRIMKVVPAGSQITFEKKSHFDFADIGEPEPILGDNGNELCDKGERYVDVNESGAWEADRGQAGIGGARDAVLYTATVRYARLFPVHAMATFFRDDAGKPIVLSPYRTLSASTVLRNQPFDEQDRETIERDC